MHFFTFDDFLTRRKCQKYLNFTADRLDIFFIRFRSFFVMQFLRLLTTWQRVRKNFRKFREKTFALKLSEAATTNACWMEKSLLALLVDSAMIIAAFVFFSMVIAQGRFYTSCTSNSQIWPFLMHWAHYNQFLVARLQSGEFALSLVFGRFIRQFFVLHLDKVDLEDERAKQA